MGMITIYHRSKKQAKKPGWREQQAEYEAWLKKVSSMSTNFSAKNRGSATSQPPKPSQAQLPEKKSTSFESFKGPTTKPVHRPELLYRDDPEMLERELRARERKFATAPMYNKGAPQLVTDEAMKDIMAGGTRRRN